FDGVREQPLRRGPGLSRASSGRRARELARREQRASPGAEVLRGERLARDLSEIRVHVGRSDRLALAVFVDVLKELLAGQLAAGARANPGQRLHEREQPAVLHFIADRRPLRVIAILLAAARIAARGLQMAVRVGAYPDVCPRRWNREGADASERRARADAAAVRADVIRMGCASFSLNPGHRPVVAMPEIGGL